jgi:hypothetical protein
MTKVHILLSLTISVLSCTQRSTATIETRNNEDSIIYLTKSLEFIKSIKPELTHDSTFILVDKPAGFDQFSCWDELLRDSSTFSREELAGLKLKKLLSHKKWTKVDFPNIRIVESDTVDKIFHDASRGWDYFYKTVGRDFNNLSYPIFLRNGNYCLFYCDNNCGWLCGTGSLTLYKFENGKWSEIRTYCNWIS